MYAIEITEDHDLVWNEVADPEPGDGEVVIEVAASAVNRADLLQRRGLYPPPAGAPPYPGLECSGRVAEIGDGVTGLRRGDEVCALLAGGGYAERVAAPAGQVLPVPRGVGLQEAAGLPEVACTAWSNLFMVAGLQEGETLLIHGGAGGVGSMAIQLARAYGVRVIATAGSPEKCRRCQELGADVAINYKEERFQEHRADVILDHLGAPHLAGNLEVLNTGGRLALIGAQGGATAEIDLGVLLRKRAAVHATTLRGRPLGEKAEIVSGVRAGVWPQIEKGLIKPVVHATVPMAEAIRAHRMLEGGENVGKVLLAP